MRSICVHCKTEGDHWVDWTLDIKSGVATVRTKCPTCGATGSTATDQQTYDAAHRKNAAATKQVEVMAVIIRALNTAKVDL